MTAGKRTGRLLISQAPMLAGDPVPRPLMAKVAVQIDGLAELILELPNDPAAISELELPKTGNIKRVEIRVLEIHNGVLGAASVGIGELMLD
jgi:hypothetical protein